MKKLNKKAEFSIIVTAIVILVSILVFSAFTYMFYISYRDKMEVQNCKNSISAHSVMVDFTKGEYFTDIKCPTKDILLNNNDEKKVKSVIAEDMHKCWYEWDKGNGKYFKGEGTFCHICSIYTFKEPDKNIEGFVQYLTTQNIKVKYPGDVPRTKYVEYFSPYINAESKSPLSDSQQRTQDILEYDYLYSSQKYATIFVYVSGKEKIQNFLETKRTTMGAVGGLAFLAGTAATVGGTTGIVLGLMSAAGTVATAGAVTSWSPVGWVLLIGAGVTAAAGGAILGYNSMFNYEEPEWISVILLTPYNAQELSNIGCEMIDVDQQSLSSS